MSTFTRHVLLTGGTTLVSRLLGFVRDAGMAWLLGAGPIADAMTVALRLPWATRRLLGEGALSLTLTAACAGRSNPAATAVAVGRALLLPLLCLTALLVLLAPDLAGVLAPGIPADTRTALSPLLRLCLPYVPLAVVSACLMAGLHATRRFARSGLMPVLFNLVVIAATFMAMMLTETPLEAALTIGCGVLLGGIIQWLPGITVLREAQRDPPADTDTARIIRSLPAGLLGAGMAQLAFLLGGILASCLPEGHMAGLFYAERLLEFPLGVLGAAVGMAAAPELRRNRDFAAPVLEWTLCLHVAAAAGLLAVAEPLVTAVFGYGLFDARAIALTTTNLQLYSLGLPAYALSRPLLTLCHSYEPHSHSPRPARLPALSALLGLAVCLVAGGLITFDLVPGLSPALGPALGTSLALWVQTLTLWLPLHRTANLKLPLGRVLWACLAGGAAFAAAHAVLTLFGLGLFSLCLAVPAGMAAWLLTLLCSPACRAFYLCRVSSAKRLAQTQIAP